MADELVPATRASSAVALRLAGAPYPQIATTLGYSTAADAQNAVERLLASTVTEDEKDLARSTMSARLDRMLQAVWPSALDVKNPKQHDAVRLALAIEDRRSRLCGLDAPTKVELYSPTAEQIQAEVIRLRGAITGPVEADIIDVDVVDGEVEAS